VSRRDNDALAPKPRPGDTVRPNARRDSDNLKVKAPGFDPIYLHCEYVDGRPHSFRISSPGKYQDASLGLLLDAIGDAATRLVRSGT
jgi:hypothetical protein